MGFSTASFCTRNMPGICYLNLCLSAMPQGRSWRNSILLKRGNGIIYPSVRFEDGLCIARFRPALVFRPRLTGTYILTITLQRSDGYQALYKKRCHRSSENVVF